jgi:hypothetical protein
MSAKMPAISTISVLCLALLYLYRIPIICIFLDAIYFVTRMDRAMSSGRGRFMGKTDV